MWMSNEIHIPISQHINVRLTPVTFQGVTVWHASIIGRHIVKFQVLNGAPRFMTPEDVQQWMEIKSAIRKKILDRVKLEIVTHKLLG